MRPARAFLAILAAASLPAAAASGTGAGASALSASASIDLRIVVPRMLEMRLLDQPATIEVTPGDAAQGEIVVTGPRVALLSNDRRGYWIDGALRGPFVEATVEGFGVPLRIDAAGGRALMPTMVGGPMPEPFRMQYRLRLREGTPPGTYRWPVVLSVQSP